MKSTVAAWGLFCLVLALPVTTLGTLGLYAGDAESARVRGNLFQSRVDTAKDLEREIELATYRAAESLRSLPYNVTTEAAREEIGASSNPFAVGFVNVHGVVDIVVPPDAMAPASDAATRDEVTAWLKSDNRIATMLRGWFLDMRGRLEVQYSRTDAVIVVFRQYKDINVGWVIDMATIRRGVENRLPPRLGFEEIPPVSAAPQQPSPVGSIINIAHKDDPNKPVFYMSRTPGKVSVGGTTEDATKVSVDPYAPNLAFRIVVKNPAQIERDVQRARLWILFVSFSCTTMLVMLASAFFKRARAAQRLADLRTDFVAAVSHELRTPLASVRMFAELLEAGDVPEDERAEVEVALAGETRRLHATLDRMLRFGALARGKLVLDKKNHLIGPIVEEAARKRRLEIEVDPTLEANVDSGLLGLAIDNLVSNAVKYAPAADDEAPNIVRAHAEGKYVVIDVIDHGPGLSKSAQKKVFLPFERADNRLSHATEGSGVGLSLVRGIARAHGGDVTVTSVLGQGATFTLRLPLA